MTDPDGDECYCMMQPTDPYCCDPMMDPNCASACDTNPISIECYCELVPNDPFCQP